MKAERIRFIFNKLRGDNRFVKPWEDLDSDQRLSMLEGVKLDADEVPVIGIAEGPTRVMITTRRIFWSSDGSLLFLDLNEIATVKVPEFMESNKLDLHRLWLITRAGSEYALETQPGKPLFVLWNLLIRILDRPKSAQ